MVENILGITGVGLTLYFGIYSIWVYLKSQKDVKLEFINIQCYSLFRNNIKDLHLNVVYNNIPVQNNLILIRASLRNNGKRDIDLSMIHKEISIVVVEDFEWLEANLVSAPDNSKISILKSEKHLNLKWDLLKAGESIIFEGLVEVKGSTMASQSRAIEFFESLKFEFRIKDLTEINKSRLIPYRSVYLQNGKYITLFIKLMISLNSLILAMMAIAFTQRNYKTLIFNTESIYFLILTITNFTALLVAYNFFKKYQKTFS